MDFIKYIDSFGIKFHFYTNNQPNHQNVFGGVMTFIYIVICIIIFIGFSYEDIYRLNPISSKSEITDIKPRKINLKKEKIWIPFRIVTDENKFIDHRGILYIIPYYIEGIKNEEIGMELNYRLLSYKLCNETEMGNKPDNYKIDVPLNELFCIDKDDIPFGGNWNGDYIYYLGINLYLCDEGIYFNSSDLRCAKANNLFNSINSSLSFDFYYPIVQFQPTNYQIPLSIIYKNYFYELSAYSYKLEKIYIQEHVLSDDKHVIRNNYQNTTCWGISSLYGDDYYIPIEEDPMIKNKINQIYTMEIYMDDGLIYYTRSYNKIFTILSKVFPIFNFCLILIKKFTQHIKISFTKRKLIELIFERKEKGKEIGSKENIKSSSSFKMKDISSRADDSHNEFIKIRKRDKNIEKQISLENNLKREKGVDAISDIPISNNGGNANLSNQNAIRILNKKEISKINSRRRSVIKNDSLKSKEYISIDSNLKQIDIKKKSHLFPYYYFFMDFFLDKLIKPHKFFCLSKKYFTIYNFMCQIYDISTHIILFKQFNIFNNLLKQIVQEHGLPPIHTFKKINIEDREIISRINKDLRTKKSIIFSKDILY
jgi:hypothetical protein